MSKQSSFRASFVRTAIQHAQNPKVFFHDGKYRAHHISMLESVIADLERLAQNPVEYQAFLDAVRAKGAA